LTLPYPPPIAVKLNPVEFEPALPLLFPGEGALPPAPIPSAYVVLDVKVVVPVNKPPAPPPPAPKKEPPPVKHPAPEAPPAKIRYDADIDVILSLNPAGNV
jgi:hypothetical protein